MAVPVQMLDQMAEWEAAVWDWVAWALEYAEGLRQTVAAGVGEGISLVEEARATLQEAAALLQEPADAAEILHDNLLNLAPHSSATLAQAGALVDALFNGAGPLAGAVAAAADIVARHFDSPPPSGGPLQDARRDLAFLFHAVHVDAGHCFNHCAWYLGIVVPGASAWELWRGGHERAGTRGRAAVWKVYDAVMASLAAHRAHHLCRARSARGRPREYILEAERTLRRTIAEIDAALLILRGLPEDLADLEVLVHNATAEAQALALIHP